MVKNDRIDVFDYLDYRAYLRDYYAYIKDNKREFSFRTFSRKARLGSPSHFKRVIEGKRNLTLEMAEHFAHACGLDVQRAEAKELCHQRGLRRADSAIG